MSVKLCRWGIWKCTVESICSPGASDRPVFYREDVKEDCGELIEGVFLFFMSLKTQRDVFCVMEQQPSRFAVCYVRDCTPRGKTLSRFKWKFIHYSQVHTHTAVHIHIHMFSSHKLTLIVVFRHHTHQPCNACDYGRLNWMDLHTIYVKET